MILKEQLLSVSKSVELYEWAIFERFYFSFNRLNIIKFQLDPLVSIYFTMFFANRKNKTSGYRILWNRVYSSLILLSDLESYLRILNY